MSGQEVKGLWSVARLREQQAEAKKLDATTAANLKGLGMAGDGLPIGWRLVKLGDLGEVNRGRSRLTNPSA